MWVNPLKGKMRAAAQCKKAAYLTYPASPPHPLPHPDPPPQLQHLLFQIKERLPALVRDLFTFSNKVIKMFKIF
jgi:hypothetical protein